MPYLNDACPGCPEGRLTRCDESCLTCNEGCGYHCEDDGYEPYDDAETDVLPEEEYIPPFNINFTQAAPTVSGDTNWSDDVTLPDSLTWYRFPQESGVGLVSIIDPNPYADSSPSFADRIAGIRSWAADNGYELSIARNRAQAITNGYQEQPTRLYIAPAGTQMPANPIPWAEDFECPAGCGSTHRAYALRCGNTRLRCTHCRFFRSSDLRREGETVPILFTCSICSPLCQHEGCQNPINSYVSFCGEHAVNWRCSHCEGTFILDTGVEPRYAPGTENALCANCEQFLCVTCETMQPRRIRPNTEGVYVCRRCFLGADDAEEFDDDAEQELAIPVIEGRENIRRCGVEIEGANATQTGQNLAAALYDAGVSNASGMGSYHSGDALGFAHVEQDSSVDWECVIGPINFAVAEDVSRLNTAVRTIRSMVRDGRLGLDLRAGCHIHIEASRTSLDGAFNLSTLFAYAEDTIFRLAAARWPIHRAVQDTHYTQPIPKEIRKVQFARAHSESDNARYYALSFNNYFRQMLSKCRCGASRYDSWEDCTCNLGKCTFEFRVFNTTANPRKLHAYFALTQALVAYAMAQGKVDPEEWPAEAFMPQRFKDMPEDTQEATVASWRTRLAWMFTYLPLTGDEKESLAYCVRNSELASVGEDFINSLLADEGEQQTIEEVAQ